MKTRIVYTLFLLFLLPLAAWAQPRYDIETIPLCWTTSGGQDSSITLYALISPSAANNKNLYYLDQNGNPVTVSGGTLRYGWCDICTDASAISYDPSSSTLTSLNVYQALNELSTRAVDNIRIATPTGDSSRTTLYRDPSSADSLPKFVDPRIGGVSAIQEAFMVDSVAQIRSLKGYVGQRILTKGFYEPGDGGGAEYIVQTDTISGLSVDSITQIPLSDGKYARIIPVNSSLDVRWFGAKGDGSTDDTEAFDKTFRAAEVLYTKSKSLVTKIICNGTFVVDPANWTLPSNEIIIYLNKGLRLKSTLLLNGLVDIIGEGGSGGRSFQIIQNAFIGVHSGSTVDTLVKAIGTEGTYIENLEFLSGFKDVGLYLGDYDNLSANFKAKNIAIQSFEPGSTCLHVGDWFWFWFEECVFLSTGFVADRSVQITNESGPSVTGLGYFVDCISGGQGIRVNTGGAGGPGGNIRFRNWHHECPFATGDTVFSLQNVRDVYLDQFYISDCASGTPGLVSLGGVDAVTVEGGQSALSFSGEPIDGFTMVGNKAWFGRTTNIVGSQMDQIILGHGQVNAGIVNKGRTIGVSSNIGDVHNYSYSPSRPAISATLEGGYTSPSGSTDAIKMSAGAPGSYDAGTTTFDLDSGDYLIYGVWIQSDSDDLPILGRNQAISNIFISGDTISLESGRGYFYGGSASAIWNVGGSRYSREVGTGWVCFTEYAKVLNAVDASSYTLNADVTLTNDTAQIWEPFIIHIDKDDYPNFLDDDALNLANGISLVNQKGEFFLKDGRSVATLPSSSDFFAQKIESGELAKYSKVQPSMVLGSVKNIKQDAFSSGANTAFSSGHLAPDGTYTAIRVEGVGVSETIHNFGSFNVVPGDRLIVGIWRKAKDEFSQISTFDNWAKVRISTNTKGFRQIWPYGSSADTLYGGGAITDWRPVDLNKKVNGNGAEWEPVVGVAEIIDTSGSGSSITINYLLNVRSGTKDTFYYWNPFAIVIDTSLGMTDNEIVEYARSLTMVNPELRTTDVNYHSLADQKYFFSKILSDSIFTPDGAANLNFDKSVTGGTSTNVQQELERADSRLDTLEAQFTNGQESSVSTNGSGDVTVTHSLGATPTTVLVNNYTANPYRWSIVAKNSTTFTVRFWDSTDTALASTSVTFGWQAIK